MKKENYALVCFLGVTLSFSSFAATLQESFQAAKDHSETSKIREQEMLQADSRYKQSRAAIFPQLSAIGTYQRMDIDQTVLLNDKEQTGARLNLTQPLFRGFGEWAQLRKVGNDLESSQYNQKAFERELFQNISQVFYSILSQEKDAAVVEELLRLTRKRGQELQSRVKIGRSRKSELLSTQSQIAILDSQFRDLEEQKQNAREQFARLTGLPSSEVLKEEDDKSISLTTSFDSLKESLQEREDLVALRKKTEAADEGVTVARAGYFPMLDFSGNYYFKRTSGALRDSRWDFLLTLTVPLFEGGVTLARVDEAVSLKSQRELEYQRALRDAELSLKQVYLSAKKASDQEHLLQEAVNTASQNAQENLREARLGLVNSLEVLQALNLYQENQRRLNQAHYDLLFKKAQLRAQLGRPL